MSAGAGLERRIRAANAEGRCALLPYLMAGFPRRAGFEALLERVAARAEIVELGLAFSDPTADGPVIAAAGQAALAEGATLAWLCERVAALRGRLAAGLVLMSYLNPLLARGLERALDELADAGFEGLIVPDVPLEEAGELRALADARGLALVQLVTPLTPPARVAALAAASRGFVYAVTRTGVTGARAEPAPVADTLARVRAASALPVCAGFGLREPGQVRALRASCDGLVVGTALIERLQRGEDPLPLLESLREAASAAGVTP